MRPPTTPSVIIASVLRSFEASIIRHGHHAYVEALFEGAAPLPHGVGFLKWSPSTA